MMRTLFNGTKRCTPAIPPTSSPHKDVAVTNQPFWDPPPSPLPGKPLKRRGREGGRLVLPQLHLPTLNGPFLCNRRSLPHPQPLPNHQ